MKAGRFDALRWAWAQTTGGGAAKLVLLALAEHVSDLSDPVCWPSLDRLAEMVEADRRTVTRALAHLEQSGVIDRDRSRGGGSRATTRYRLNLDQVGRDASAGYPHQGRDAPLQQGRDAPPAAGEWDVDASKWDVDAPQVGHDAPRTHMNAKERAADPDRFLTADERAINRAGLEQIRTEMARRRTA